ncbi:hypothetical protein ACFRIB_19375 [Streptomyces mirabilis]|uniref:deazapurine DNA modification protein DpdA family protein n=1 Tax=Streptomyces mirabilis TaxID=68239 RepID=UPI0036A9ACC4
MCEHIDRTVGNFVDLIAEDPGVDIIPTVQGWRLADYEACLDLYDKRGVRLADYPLVGVGSVCRRKSVKDVEAVLATVAAAGLSLHGFGLLSPSRHLSGVGSLLDAPADPGHPGCRRRGPGPAEVLEVLATKQE